MSNTSPVLNLAIINRLALLREQFGDIWVPSAVIEELRLGEELPGSHTVREAREAGWLQVGEVKDRSLVQVLQRDLDGGEAEAIALALQMKMGELRERAGFHIDAELAADLLEESGEKNG